MATGCLSAASLPAIRGLETFQGNRYHTAHWPHGGVNFSGQVDTGYYQTFNRPNVTLIDIRTTPIEEITATGLRTS
jgi:cation diffusion facilitator CzcD-associated flavoprotein CzcO